MAPRNLSAKKRRKLGNNQKKKRIANNSNYIVGNFFLMKRIMAQLLATLEIFGEKFFFLQKVESQSRSCGRCSYCCGGRSSRMTRISAENTVIG